MITSVYLLDYLDMAVPLLLLQWQREAKEFDANEFEQAKQWYDATGMGEWEGVATGDVTGSRNQAIGHQAGKVATIIAILARQPGGVKFCGRRYEDLHEVRSGETAERL